jgi:general secretion pathway protein I
MPATLSNHPRTCAGFTLLEVLVAVAVLGIAMVAVLKGAGDTQDALVQSRDMTVATGLAEGLLAEVEAVGPNQWTFLNGDFGEEAPDYTWRVEMEPYMDTGLILVRAQIHLASASAGVGEGPLVLALARLVQTTEAEL